MMLESWFGWPALGLFSLSMVVPFCLALLWLARRREVPVAPLSSDASPAVNESASIRDEVAAAPASRANLALFQQKRREWQLQLEQGELPAAAYTELVAESRQQLLAEIDATPEAAIGQRVPASAASLVWQRALLGITALSIPLLAYFLYLPAGYSLGAADQQAVVAQLQSLKGAANQDARRRAVDQLREVLEQQTRSLAPDPQLLRLHAEVLLSSGDYQRAMRVYQRMLERAPDNAGIIAQLAEAHYLQANASRADNAAPATFSPRASELLDRALGLDPQHPRALGLAGIRAFERREWQQAIEWWQRAAAAAAPGSQQRAMVDSGIAAARERLATQSTPVTPGTSGGVAQQSSASLGQGGEAITAATHFVKLAVSVDAAQLRSSDTASTPVFVFARPADGSRMPLAAKRLQLGDLPTTIAITDRDKMAGRSIADVAQVIVGARLARSGQPIAAAGDIESAALTVTVEAVGNSGGDSRPENFSESFQVAPLHQLRIERSRD